MRLIDADALEEEMCSGCEYNKSKYANCVDCAIANAPTIDAEPVVRCKDCTEFMKWLKDEVLDEENWELNAIAYGEIICRKFKELGWIDVEDGFYVSTPTIEPKQGEWIEKSKEDDSGYWVWTECSECGRKPLLNRWNRLEETSNYCPYCGAKMYKEKEDG